MGILCKGSLNVVVSALGPLKTSLLTSTKGNILSAFLSWRDSCTHSQLMHMFNLCMLCFFLLCINDYLHLFLLDFMIASCVENIIAFRLLGCILFDFAPLASLHVGCKFWGCALVHQRRSTSAAHRRKSPSMAPLDWRWCVRLTSSAQAKMCLCAGPARVHQRTVHFSGEFSKRPHFTYGLYIYANLILGHLQEFLFMLHT